MKIIYIYILIALTAIFISCNKDELSIGETSISSIKSIDVSTIPFTDETTLEEISSNPENVPYTTARKLAIIEMETGINESMEWNGTSLSKKPIVVYDKNSKAKYYEFIVSDESSNTIGTVTACALKEADASISHVLPYVRDYSNFTTKGSDYKLISGGYPTRILLGITGKSGESVSSVVDPETGESVSNIISEDAQGMIDALLLLTEAERDSIGITNLDSIINGINEKDALNEQYATDFWATMDSLTEGTDSITDEEIVASINESKGTKSWTSYDEYIIPRYNETNLKRTRWNGWCGPSALAWIYRGLYSSYKGTKLPLYGDSDFYKKGYREKSGKRGNYDFNDDNDDDDDGFVNDLDEDWVNNQSKNADGGLYAKLAKDSWMYAWVRLTENQNGPTTRIGLNRALNYVTNFKYGITTAYSITGTGAAGHKHIRDSKLPIISWCENLSHYVVGFGSKYKYWNWKLYVKVFRKKRTIASIKVRTDKWLLVTDNGNTTKKHDYAPYWKNDKFCYDLQYGVCKRY